MEPILIKECPICLIDIKTEKTKKLDCGHIYHEHCIKKWIAFQNGAPRRPSCPTCRIIRPKQKEEHQNSCFGFCFYYRHRNR